jgi:hypothetical protein
MSSAETAVRQADSENTVAPSPDAPIRYHALDWVRVTAMLLGVFYHLPIAFMGGGFGFLMNPKMPIDNWLHSFRMPLFFLISGFFAKMMLEKYGLKRYLTRRWWRIGAPLFIAIFALAGLRYATDPFRGNAPGAFGPMPAPGFPFPTVPNNPTPPNAAAPGGQPGGGMMPFGAPPAGVPGMPTPGVPGMPTQGAPAAPAFFPPVQMPPPPARTLADRLFGTYSRYFNMEHLWFLWYLLVFVTVAPFVAMIFSRIPMGRGSERLNRFGAALLRYHLIAPVLGLIALPALMHARGYFGWALANPIGFLAPFPDFMYQYHPDLPHYFVYFLTGWYLYRLRSGLDDLIRSWLWCLALGIACFVASQRLSNAYAFRPDAPHIAWIRLGSFALYSVGAAFNTFAFVGFFQRYLNKPTRLGRYLADTILWVYLVHIPLIPFLLGWIQPGRAPWWVDSLAGMALITGVALLLYELIVRPTPLVHVFGPPQSPRPRQPETSR